jgi:hypothetical protein
VLDYVVSSVAPASATAELIAVGGRRDVVARTGCWTVCAARAVCSRAVRRDSRLAHSPGPIWREWAVVLPDPCRSLREATRRSRCWSSFVRRSIGATAGADLWGAPILTIELVREGMPLEWQAEWELRREDEMREARRLRHAGQVLR